MTNLERVDTYEKLGKLKWRRSVISLSRMLDPTNAMHMSINAHLAVENRELTDLISKNFDLSGENYTKYEFIWLPQKARYVGKNAEEPFTMDGSLSVMITKPRSLILTERKYRFTIAKGCGSTGTLRSYKSGAYEMEEIYYNKITTVSAYHHEDTYKVINSGCMAKEGLVTISIDGFTIRAGENFRVVASDKYSQELAEARSFINSKISEVN